KGELYPALDPRGTAVFNLDLDPRWLAAWRGNLPCLQTLGFSLDNPAADITAKRIALDSDGRASFVLQAPAGEVPVNLQVPGRHTVANALAAAACAIAVGADLDAVAAGLRAVLPAPGRMQVLRGQRGARLIDDSYNANPGSVHAAIDALAGYAGRRLLVLGDM